MVYSSAYGAGGPPAHSAAGDPEISVPGLEFTGVLAPDQHRHESSAGRHARPLTHTADATPLHHAGQAPDSGAAMSPSKMLRGIAMDRSRSTEGSRDKGRKWRRKEILMGQAGLRALRDGRSFSGDDGKDLADNAAAPATTSVAENFQSLICSGETVSEPVAAIMEEQPSTPILIITPITMIPPLREATPVAPAVPEAPVIVDEVIPEAAVHGDLGSSHVPEGRSPEHTVHDGSSIYADVDGDVTPTNDVPTDGVQTENVTNELSTFIIPEAIAVALAEGRTGRPVSFDLSMRRTATTSMVGQNNEGPYIPTMKGRTRGRSRSTRPGDDRPSVGRGNGKFIDWIRGVFKRGGKGDSFRATSHTSAPSSPVGYHMPDLAQGRAFSDNRPYRSSSAVLGFTNEPDSFRSSMPETYSPLPPAPSSSPTPAPPLNDNKSLCRAKAFDKKRSYKLFPTRSDKLGDTRSKSIAVSSLPLPDLGPKAPSRTTSPLPQLRSDSRADSPTQIVKPLPLPPPPFALSDLERLYHDLCLSGLSIAEIATIHDRASMRTAGVENGIQRASRQGDIPLNREVGSGAPPARV
ncbi:hypothetical protein HK101_000276 [Irineochytrium annulatum]|nr:hypothetical protein HK101_000276 [Irineochytrium annulatum]